MSETADFEFDPVKATYKDLIEGWVTVKTGKLEHAGVRYAYVLEGKGDRRRVIITKPWSSKRWLSGEHEGLLTLWGAHDTFERFPALVTRRGDTLTIRPFSHV